MLLAIEVSLYCPRFVVMDVKDGKARIIHTAMNDHLREAAMAQRNRTPVGELLMEIAESLEFILTAFPISDAVWSMRQLGVANADAAKTALGAVLLTLAQHGITPDEMKRSRMLLLLTGTSKSDARHAQSVALRILPTIQEGYSVPILSGLAWGVARHLLLSSPPFERTDCNPEAARIS